MGGRAKNTAGGVGRLDLNAARLSRAKALASRRGVKGTTLPIVFGPGDKVIAELGPELPLDVFSPLLAAVGEIDLPALIVQVMEALKHEDEQEATAEAVIGVLVTNPNLPTEIVTAVQGMGRMLLGGGYEDFVAQRPSGQDVGALISGLLEWYGVSLGEFWRSSTSSEPGGGTSTPTSPTTTPASNSSGPGDSPGNRDSSASAA